MMGVHTHKVNEYLRGDIENCLVHGHWLKDDRVTECPYCANDEAKATQQVIMVYNELGLYENVPVSLLDAFITDLRMVLSSWHGWAYQEVRK